ncbi:MAG TPA: ATP-binding protein [Myxococcota bacterium]|nr:ATP-binding protein [Myxococcota bacterium]
MPSAGAEPVVLRDAKRQLAHLMAARLLLMLAVFAIAISLVGAGNPGAELREHALYGTLTFAFLSTAVCAALLPRMQNVSRLAAAQLAADLATVTAIVFLTDGARSLFSFLYLPLVMYAALPFERRGAYAVAICASICLGAMLVLDTVGAFGVATRGLDWEWRFGVWGAHTGALLLVALLASTLVRERRVASEDLASSASDLRELRSLHERMVDSLTSGLITLDARGIATSCNPEGARILSRRLGEIVGAPLERLAPGIHEIAMRGSGGAQRARVELTLPSGEPRYLGVAASILRASEGEGAGRVVIFQDVTQVVSLERALRQRERLAAVGELAAGVAHEVRNPLAAISGCVEMLRALNRERSGDLEQERLMSIVLREIERLDALISDFLQFARPAAPKLESIALAALLEEIAEMCRAACPTGVRVRVDAPAALRVSADATQLRQVIWNLVRNAVQAVGERGEIRLAAGISPGGLPQADDRASRSGSAGGRGAVEIVVADDGPGIDADALERIFDPFFTTKRTGTGLGLATVHRIVTAHGGAIDVKSAPSMGASFRVLLPLAEGAQ